MDRQDLQQHIDSKKYDDPNERFKIIAKIALWIFIIIGVIVLTVLGGKTYIDAKNIDAGRDATNLKTAEIQLKVMESVNTFLLILSRTMPESFKDIDGKNLLNVTEGIQ
jgi:predicted metal-dependent phosphotriesterase family hydrolase